MASDPRLSWTCPKCDGILEEGDRFCECDEEFNNPVPAQPSTGEGWRDMESAPKDGASILVQGWPGQSHGTAIVFWEDGYDEAGWLYDDYRQGPIIEDGWAPTAWMPLPAPSPKGEVGG